MELFDLYDAQRRLTGETMVRGENAPEGRYHLVVHVCIFNSKGELLIQQRQPFKDGWPNLWDISVGGSVISGEDSQQGARRELLEELGLDVDFSGEAPTISTTFPGGFDDLYIIRRDAALSSLRLQPEEVQAARWATREEVLSMLEEGTFIPYSRPLMEYIFFRFNHCGNFDADR